MYAFFFATLVALSLSTSNLTSSTLTPATLENVYNESGTLVAFYFDASNEDEPIADSGYGDVEHSEKYFSIQVPNFEPIEFKTVVDYGALAGSATSSYIGIEAFVVGSSISTNLYLEIDYVQLGSNGNWRVQYPDWKMSFKGQYEKYWDNYDGQYQLDFDIPYSLQNYSLYMSFYIKCEDAQLQEGVWYNNGYNDGKTAGLSEGETTGYNNGYSVGYQAGYEQGYSTDSTVTSIFSGILQVALVPINFFLAIFNFEILGINLSGFIRALFTIAITVIIIRTIFGGKGASDS